MIQFFVHVKMLFHPQFKCNPKSSVVCNNIALAFGIIYVIVFSRALFTDYELHGKINSLFASGVFIGLYSVVSHIVHIPLGDILYRSKVAKIVAVCIIALAIALIIKHAENGLQNLKFHTSILFHEQKARKIIDDEVKTIPGKAVIDAGAWQPCNTHC